MKISSVPNFCNYSPQVHLALYRNLMPLAKDTVSFGSNDGCYKSVYSCPILKKEIETNVNTTSQMFRNDVDWEILPDWMEKRFADKEKVNLISHACSDGSEAYSLAIILLEKLGKEKAAKYLPIQATDLMIDLIEFAKSGHLALCDDDFERFETFNIDYKKYFEEEESDISTPFDRLQDTDILAARKTFRVKDELRNLVEFKQCDIVNDLKELEDNSNTVLFFKNALPYINHQKRTNIYNLLGEKLNGKSMLLLGKHDQLWLDDNSLHSELSKTGMKKLKNEYDDNYRLTTPFCIAYSKEL